MNSISRTFDVRPAARFILFAALLALVFVGSAHSSALASVPVAQAAQMLPVESLRNPDGTLNLATGVNGAVDPRGWAVTLDPKRGPLFQPGALSPAAATGGVWSPLGTGTAGGLAAVMAIAISGSNMYVGGWFTVAGGVANTYYIAKWNGSTWSPLGTGLNGNVYAIAVSASGDVYAGGDFTDVHGGGCSNCAHIAKWNGTTWSALGTGMTIVGPTNRVNAIAVSGTNVYVGGDFYGAGGVANTAFLARWDGANWNASGGMTSPVHAIAISGSDVIVSGEAQWLPGCSNCKYIGKWNGSTWSPLGTGLGGTAHALVVSGSYLYAGGDFPTAGTCTTGCNTIAKWDGSTWSALGTGTNGGQNTGVEAIAVSGSDVYAGGYFTSAGTCDSVAGCNRIAKWDGATWSALGAGMSGGIVDAIAVRGGGISTSVYAGGGFNLAGTCDSAAGCNHIARFGLWMSYLPFVKK